MAEQRSPKPQVGGSNPSWPVRFITKMNKIEFIKKNIYIFFIIITLIFFLSLNYFFALKEELKIISYILIVSSILLYIYKTKYIKKITEYLKDSKTELKNITWPKLKDARQSTFAVLIIVLITSIIIWILDSILTYIIAYILKG